MSRRIARSKKRSVGIAPIYEINLNGNEPNDTEEVMEILVEPGQRLELRCTAGVSIDRKTLSLKQGRNHIDVVEDFSSNKVSYFIPSFDRAKDGGLFECTASRLDTGMHSRKLRLREWIQLPSGAKECDMECYNDGICIESASGAKSCICPADYGGKQCEAPVLTDFVVGTAKVAVGCGGLAYFLLILTAIIFAVLFVKEKKKRRVLLEKYGHLEQSPYGDMNFDYPDPSNPYRECTLPRDGTSTKLPIYNCEVVRETEPTSFNMSIRKFRKAIRTRLPGTSDSKCFIEPITPNQS